VFVVLSLLWGWLVDRVVPDRYHVAGVALMMYAPRAS
jgi:drug/metabolite transporter superfamily protein YnfA